MTTPPSDANAPRILLAGGGSAGHVSPLLATAAALQARRPGTEVLVLGTESGLEADLVPAAGFELLTIDKVPFPRRPDGAALRFPRDFHRAVRDVTRILTDRGILAVGGFGGYVCPPAYRAAAKADIPRVIHEANLVPGLANRLGARGAAAVLTAFPDTPLPHARRVGMPMRAGIAKLDRTLPLTEPGRQPMTRILVVEDEQSFSDPLSYTLRKEGYEVAVAETGTEALRIFGAHGVDLVLLDLMLPGLSGTEVCREIRRTSSVPVIMLTAKDDEFDKVLGLELGADDYVTKPYSSRELLARIKAVLRRRQDTAEDEEDATLRVGGIEMDVDRHVVSVRGEQVTLPLKEFELLELLLRNADRVLTRGQLIDRIWGADYVGDTKTLDVHVKRLRAKVEEDPKNPVHLVTVRGLGYKFESLDH
jgi:two-component system response regulator RegX3